MSRGGVLEVVTGPMFSGKTDELIARFHQALTQGISALACKPARDDRHPTDRIVSHSGLQIPAVAVYLSLDLLTMAQSKKLMLIDEIQFFGTDLVAVVDQLLGRGRRVVAVGLDLDFRREPFLMTSELMARADNVSTLTATCRRCGAPGTLTQRLRNGLPASLEEPQLVVGDQDLYEPRCERCWREERGIAT